MIGPQEMHIVVVHNIATTRAAPCGKQFYVVSEDPAASYWPRFNRMCDVPLRSGWRAQVWDIGVRAKLIEPLSGHGHMSGHSVKLGEEWRAVVGDAVRSGELS